MGGADRLLEVVADNNLRWLEGNGASTQDKGGRPNVCEQAEEPEGVQEDEEDAKGEGEVGEVGVF